MRRPKDKMKPRDNTKRRALGRQRNLAKYQMPKDADINYKNVPLLQKYLNDKGKIVPRRISGISAIWSKAARCPIRVC